ncbi:Cobalamin synthase CobS (adenosylcobinamide-GDP ribazoletransferase) (CobS) (PUBMED:31481610) [Commensalibacter communis]|uniref:adenosylcobinamide-GDP ribazoletransferase n=1 Tax=Commensalibacter communis TaxID=2972786 RepID=UPI0022FF7269|nr:adenosylcobinamide-GDP ribazoletransferase [Commensalibacter communis]CAI3923693.1 Cobalamin synthase CobS (adenosylcobinamide-GDP ribazoletransferase) (CobS) (PUBMED:31481610) [Commensalibacter communis]CAI3935710.1 Cobalamin synthase CobS (adenosylcobinamide-GDP ribazoletransferase) (CobS) (PUBMED:31481610) [Commensalibacter communis]
MSSIYRKIHADLYCGLSFFSRLPVQWLYRSDFPFSFGRAIWTWPLVSFILGSLNAIFFFTASRYFPSSWIIAFLTIGFQLLLTGGLHEDGLADMADGFGGGKAKEHKLSIMRDSRLGTYGVLTLVIILGLQASSLAFLVQYSYKAIPILIITAILSRMSILLPIYISKPARDDGLASTLKNTALPSTIIAALATFILTFSLAPLICAIAYSLLAIIIAIGITSFCYRHIQGYTGDILGAIQVFVATGILVISTIFVALF